MTISDRDLLAKARYGDRDALSSLLRRHGPNVRRTLDINPKWSSMLEKDDVMQVTYYEAFHHIVRRPPAAESFIPWLTRIAQNNLRDAIDWLECAKRPQPNRRMTPPPNQDSVAWLFEHLTSDGTTPTKHAANGDLRHILATEVERLPQDHAQVIRRLYFEQQTVQEVAAKLNKTPGAVYMLRARAIDRLRERLGSGSQFFSS